MVRLRYASQLDVLSFVALRTDIYLLVACIDCIRDIYVGQGNLHLLKYAFATTFLSSSEVQAEIYFNHIQHSISENYIWISFK